MVTVNMRFFFHLAKYSLFMNGQSSWQFFAQIFLRSPQQSNDASAAIPSGLRAINMDRSDHSYQSHDVKSRTHFAPRITIDPVPLLLALGQGNVLGSLNRRELCELISWLNWSI